MISMVETKSHNWWDCEEAQFYQLLAFTEVVRTNGEQARNDPRLCKTPFPTQYRSIPNASAGKCIRTPVHPETTRQRQRATETAGTLSAICL